MGENEENLKSGEMNVTILFQKRKISLSFNINDPYLNLKQQVFNETRVLPHRQKLLGIKSQGRSPSDNELLNQLTFPPAKGGVIQILLVGTPEEEIFEEPEIVPYIFDDFESEFWPNDDVIQDQQTRRENLEKTLSQVELNIINPLDQSKKLVVLDLDNTLFDFSARKYTSLRDTMRPGLISFLQEIYQYYNIAVWSATNWHWVEIKLTELGILTNLKFNICFVLDKSSMIKVKSMKKGKTYEHLAKPLPFIWNKLNNFHERNTIHVDDIPLNFAMNLKNGIKIKAFNYSEESKRSDNELFYLGKYLAHIALIDDLTSLDHTNWRTDTEQTLNQNNTNN